MSDFLTNRENNRRGSGERREKPPSESDSLTYRSILNEEPERSVASNKYRSASKPITSQPMSHESDDEDEEFHSVKSSHNANLNSFYLAGDADDEDESQRHFKSIHIPTNELTTSHNDTADTTRRNSASNNSGNDPMRDSSATIGNSGIELDTVKHKLSSIWNNVKYGWSNYLKKPNKIDLDKNEEIYILGKRFTHLEANAEPTDMNKIGNSSFYFCNDTLPTSPTSPASLEANYSIIAPSEYESALTRNKSTPRSAAPIAGVSQSVPPRKPHKSTSADNDADADYLSMTYSYLSSSSILSNLLSKSLSTDSLTKSNERKLQKLTNDKMKTRLEQEIYSRLWFTYRKDFPALVGNNNARYTTDCGWGCMLRSGQMLMAQGLLYHSFGADWSLYRSLRSRTDIARYRHIIALFNDRRDSTECPLGIHNLLAIADRAEQSPRAAASPSRVGTWFGPTSVCQLIRDAVNSVHIESFSGAANTSRLLSGLRVYVAQDCTVYKQDVLNLCLFDKQFIPCILLVPVRLGGESINEIYVDSLKMFFQMPNCIGMIGGRPKHSLYFIGYQNEKVIYLDPHICQPAVNIYSITSRSGSTTNMQTSEASSAMGQHHTARRSPSPSPSPSPNALKPPHHHHHPHLHRSSSSSLSNSSSSSDSILFDNSSFHCAHPNRIDFGKLDPSLAIGFYCATLDDFNEFCQLIQKNSNSEYYYPIFGICEDTFEKTQLNYENFSLDDKSHSHYQSPQKQQQTPTNGSRSRSSTGSSTTVKGEVGDEAAASSKHLKTTSNSSLPQSPSSKSNHLKRHLKSTLSAVASSAKPSSSASSSSVGRKPSTNKKSDHDDFVLV